MRERFAGEPNLHLVTEPSPAALADLPVAELYVVDGDHNYAVVRAELASPCSRKSRTSKKRYFRSLCS